MKITYNQNPLKTTIELTEEEQREYWLKIKVEQMIWIIVEIEYYLEALDEKYFNLKKAREYANSEYLCDKENGLDKEVDHRFKIYHEALQEEHMGDCTYVSCSCVRCHAENILGVDTIKGLSGNPGHYINMAFRKTNDINEAIKYLENYELNEKDLGTYAEYAETWKLQARHAAKLLTKYRNEHFGTIV